MLLVFGLATATAAGPLASPAHRRNRRRRMWRSRRTDSVHCAGAGLRGMLFWLMGDLDTRLALAALVVLALGWSSRCPSPAAEFAVARRYARPGAWRVVNHVKRGSMYWRRCSRGCSDDGGEYCFIGLWYRICRLAMIKLGWATTSVYCCRQPHFRRQPAGAGRHAGAHRNRPQQLPSVC